MPNVAHAAVALLAGLLSPQQHHHGDPSNDEQHVLELVNRARADPFAEGARLGIDLREGLTPQEAERVGRRPPLAFNPSLLEAARAHSRDMHARSFFDHVNPDGDDPGSRAAAAGYFWNRIGENIAAGSSLSLHTAGQLQDLLLIDATVEGRGHRKNLLDVSGALLTPPVFREIGVGYAAFPQPNELGFRVFLTQDFGRRSQGPFLVGVVFHDRNGNDFYDPGEGVPGIRVHQDSGPCWAVSSASGGYACPAGTSGEVTVTPSGGGIAWSPTVFKTARLEGENVKVDFKTSDAADTDEDGMPDAWEVRNGLNPSTPSDAGLDPDGDGTPNLEEFRFGTAPNDAGSFPGARPAPRPVPPPGSPEGDDSSDSSGCGLMGLDLLLSLIVLRRARRLAN